MGLEVCKNCRPCGILFIGQISFNQWHYASAYNYTVPIWYVGMSIIIPATPIVNITKIKASAIGAIYSVNYILNWNNWYIGSADRLVFGIDKAPYFSF